uniref:Uncharacterized protein n=1 Tax=Romanomermis culicivorax TaxID=13658 RepID=A0A915LBY0_ROMCU
MSIILSTMPVMNGDWITQLIDEIDEITGIAAAHQANISYDFQSNSTVNSILQPENMSAQWNSRRKTPSPRIKSPNRNEQSTSSSNNQKRSSPLVGRPLLDANLQATYGFPNHWCKISPEIFERRRRYRLEKLSHRNDDTLIDLS